jgi:hypothetical protein
MRGAVAAEGAGVMAHDEAGSAAIKLSELVEAFDFVSVSEFEEHHAYICRKSGRIFFMSDDVEIEENSPKDLDGSEQYEAVPHRRDLALGKRIALSFVEEELPASLPEATEIFSHKGAYGKFKRLLEVNGILDRWYAFEERAVAAALRKWCDEVGLTLIE